MKTFLVLSILATSGSAFAAKPLKVENIRQIVCLGYERYEEDSKPEDRPTSKEPTSLSIFHALKEKGAMQLVDYAPDVPVNDEKKPKSLVSMNSGKYYFSLKGNVLSFEFVAAWKASGELRIEKGVDYMGAYSAAGELDQKGHITPLKCAIHLK